MFGLFGSPKRKLEKEYAKITEDAMNAQRNGNIALYAELSQKAQEIYAKIQELEKQEKN
jgi:hypothetical protein